MRKLILLLTLAPTIAFGQTTAIPDTAFEQALIDLGYDTAPIDGSVPTANISSIDSIWIYSSPGSVTNITDLTGIEDFAALVYLYCAFESIHTLDVSNNTALAYLNCEGNQIYSLDLSNNTALTYLNCCCNFISCLNVNNGNNANFTHFSSTGNSVLNCIEVDDSIWSTANWLNIDSIAYFSENCNYSNNCNSRTAIPDLAFEVTLQQLGYDKYGFIPDGYVSTAVIETVEYLNISYWLFGVGTITDLTGIEDFSALDTLIINGHGLVNLDFSNNAILSYLNCTDNELVNLDVSNNTNLSYLNCADNELVNLDVSNKASLSYLNCDDNELVNLDVSNSTSLDTLYMPHNNVTELDLSSNHQLTYLFCLNNELTCLNLKNGNNQNMTTMVAALNASLSCIEVDDAAWSTANWAGTFSEDCNNPCSAGYVGIHEINEQPKHLLNIYDLLGRPTTPVPNQILLYKYSDGSVEKKIQLDR